MPLCDLDELFTEAFVEEYIKDPVGLFNSLPDPQKRRLARLSDDKSSDGSSYMASYADEDPKKKSA